MGHTMGHMPLLLSRPLNVMSYVFLCFDVAVGTLSVAEGSEGVAEGLRM